MTTEAENVTKAKAVCKCGHAEFLHDMEAADKQCSLCTVPPFWYDYMPQEGQPLESAKQETQSSSNSSIQQSTTQPTSVKKGKSKTSGNGNDEQKFAHLFAAATEKIDKLTSDANQKKEGIDTNLKKSIKKVVRDLANDLKAQGFPVNRIAGEIVQELSPKRASRSWILEILPDEYKDKARQENARKRKHKAASVVKQSEENLPREVEHFAPLAEQSQKMIGIGVDGHEVVIPNPGQDLVNKESSRGQKRVGDPDPVNPSSELGKKVSSPSPYPLRVLIDWDELSDKMAELHHKDITNFWLCGQVNENGKLIDMVLERSRTEPSSHDDDDDGHQIGV